MQTFHKKYISKNNNLKKNKDVFRYIKSICKRKNKDTLYNMIISYMCNSLLIIPM